MVDISRPDPYTIYVLNKVEELQQQPLAVMPPTDAGEKDQGEQEEDGGWGIEIDQGVWGPAFDAAAGLYAGPSMKLRLAKQKKK